MSDRIYYSHEAEMQANQERAAAIMAFLAVGVIVGAVVALLIASRPKPKRRHFADRVGEGLEPLLEATAATVRTLEKDLNDLRKRVEQRVGELR